MSRVSFFSRFVMPALLVGLLLGVGAGLALAGGLKDLKATASSMQIQGRPAVWQRGLRRRSRARLVIPR
jgi:hypothetical protein